jgi:hypothetical protein
VIPPEAHELYGKDWQEPVTTRYLSADQARAQGIRYATATNEGLWICVDLAVTEMWINNLNLFNGAGGWELVGVALPKPPTCVCGSGAPPGTLHSHWCDARIET